MGAENALKLVAKDLVQHFEARIVALEGKVMIVCMSRRICVALYDQIVDLRREWHSDEDEEGAVKIVMTGRRLIRQSGRRISARARNGAAS